MGPATVRAVRANTNLPIDVPLMIEDPLKYLDMFVDAGDTSEAGARIFIIGSAIFDADDRREALARLRNLASGRIG